MASFAMVIAKGAAGESQRRIFDQIRVNLAGMAEGLSEDRVETDSQIAAKLWLAHSRTQGMARDAATGSWLACVGTPGGKVLRGVGAERAAGVLLGEYLKRGREAITVLDAPFAILIFDGRAKTTHFVTDRLGLGRMYWAETDGAQVFSTSSLALAGAIGARLDPAGVAAYFRVGHLLGEMTLWRRIRKIGAAQWIEIGEGRTKEDTYWRPPAGVTGGGDLDEWAQAAGEASVEALERALVDGEPTTVELTGGLDSRFNFMAALAAGKPFTAWTIGDVSESDTRIASEVAASGGARHTVVSALSEIEETFWEDFLTIHRLTDGETDCVNVIASPAANRQSKGLRTQSVSGSGGDVLRGRYYRSRRLLAGGVSIRKLVDWQMCLGSRYESGIFADEFADADGTKLDGVVRRALENTQGIDGRDRLDRFYLWGPVQGVGGCSMAFNNFYYRQSAPFFTNKMIETALAIPARFKARGLVVRRAVELLNSGIAEIKLGTGLPARKLRARDAGKVISSYAAYGRRAARKAAANLGLSGEVEKKSMQFAAVVNERLIAVALRELVPERMASARLYKAEALRAFVKRNVSEGLPNKMQIGLILSMELTAREAGRSL